eukprot:7314898-Lingulodinium_polyedra.AAC.1
MKSACVVAAERSILEHGHCAAAKRPFSATACGPREGSKQMRVKADQGLNILGLRQIGVKTPEV